MRRFSFEDVVNATGGTPVNSERVVRKITSVTMDSRKVVQGSLFVAIKGERVDGHDFIKEVFSKGAAAVLCDHVPEGVIGPCVVVEDTVKGLQEVARWYRSTLNVKVVGITGSVGKTSTKEMVAAVLAEKFNVLKTIGNYNNEIGLPLTVLSIEEDTEIAVLEMGISDFGEMRVLSRIACPDICVITNIGQCHLEFLHDRDGILKAKSEIFEFMNPEGRIYLNGDDDKLVTVTEVKGIKPTFFGLKNTNDVYPIAKESMGLGGTRMRISLRGSLFDAEIHMLGDHMVSNAMAASAIASDLGMDKNQIAAGLYTAKTIDGRSNLIPKGTGYIIDDCYNASPASMMAALDTLNLATGRKVAILGDMFELGPDSDNMHAAVGRYAVSIGIDKLICVGENSRHMYSAALKEKGTTGIGYYTDLESLIKNLKIEIKEGDNVLVKSSHGMGFARLVEALKEL
ncbi:MAG: UDP-N-acetylmuramoyl-tripeptide--D-alanyl-D-alanine ligase [Lachnospiraceae bacterium]|nr:UDP-N-acetylmuramoyl-tripeptide--D-alanyl-D-alanine ligase [Lachnospiraceae bacterium]